MGGYILKRLVSAIPVLFGITIIVFLIMSMILRRRSSGLMQPLKTWKS